MGRWDERLTEDGKKGARCVSVRMNRYHIHGCSFIECWTRMCTRTGNQADRWERGGNNRNNKRCEFLRSKANIAIASKCTVESVIFYLFNAFVRRFMLCIWLRAYFFPRLFFVKWQMMHTPLPFIFVFLLPLFTFDPPFSSIAHTLLLSPTLSLCLHIFSINLRFDSIRLDTCVSAAVAAAQLLLISLFLFLISFSNSAHFNNKPN